MPKAKPAEPQKPDPHKPDLPIWSTVFDMPLDELQRRVTQADALMKQAVGLFPGLFVMTDDERKTTTGRLRTGEGPIFLKVVEIIEAFPSYFAGLADLDEGIDPKVVETPLIRDRIERAEILAKLIDDAEKLTGLSDTVLHLRALVREPIKEAYAISKAMKRTNEALKTMLVPVLNYYAAMAKAALASRQANQAAAEAKAAAAAKG